jgi:predicted metal-dependent hydrolase
MREPMRTSDAIPIRNLRFATDGGDVPRRWHPRGAAVTSFFNNLSLFFPAGERFFVAAVNRYKKTIRRSPATRDAAGRDRVLSRAGGLSQPRARPL